jgi:hypothetical protein
LFKISMYLYLSKWYNHKRKVCSFLGCLVWRLNNTTKRTYFFIFYRNFIAEKFTKSHRASDFVLLFCRKCFVMRHGDGSLLSQMFCYKNREAAWQDETYPAAFSFLLCYLLNCVHFSISD